MKPRKFFFALPLLLLGSPAFSKTLDVCFSPLGHCDQVMVSWINSSARSLDGAIYGLTDPTIAAAFKRAKKRGVAIRLIQDKSQSKDKHAVYRQLQQDDIDLRLLRGSGGGIQHNKFLIIDDKYVITGSFNWTMGASHRNDENFVVLDDQTPRFEKEFARLWDRAMHLRTR